MGGSSNKSASCSNVIVVLHKKRLSIVRYGWTYLCDLSVFCKQNTKVTCVKGFINTDDRHYQSSIILLLATFIKCKKNPKTTVAKIRTSLKYRKTLRKKGIHYLPSNCCNFAESEELMTELCFRKDTPCCTSTQTLVDSCKVASGLGGRFVSLYGKIKDGT